MSHVQGFHQMLEVPQKIALKSKTVSIPQVASMFIKRVFTCNNNTKKIYFALTISVLCKPCIYKDIIFTSIPLKP